MPRPKGKATRVIVTVFPVPRQSSVIHDLDVDSKGHVWYGDSGWGYIGNLDPTTGRFSEYQAPNHRRAPAAGLKGVVGVQAVQVDTDDNIWAVVGGNTMAYFDTKTEKWVEFEMPADAWAFLTPFRKGDTQTTWTTGRIRQPGGQGPLTAFRLNYKTGKIEASYPIMVDKSGRDMSGPVRLNVYGIAGESVPFCYQIDRVRRTISCAPISTGPTSSRWTRKPERRRCIPRRPRMPRHAEGAPTTGGASGLLSSGVTGSACSIRARSPFGNSPTRPSTCRPTPWPPTGTVRRGGPAPGRTAWCGSIRKPARRPSI